MTDPVTKIHARVSPVLQAEARVAEHTFRARLAAFTAQRQGPVRLRRAIVVLT